MNVRLTIGILRTEGGWTLLLRQSGVAFERVQDVETLHPADYSVVIVNRSLSNRDVEALAGFVEAGGAILDTGHFLKRHRPELVGRHTYSSIIPSDTDSVDSQCLLLDVNRRGYQYSKGGIFEGVAGLFELGRGYFGFIGFDVNRSILDCRVRRKQFYGPLGTFPSERVGLVSKGEIRRLVGEVLRDLHFRRGLPYVHKWYFPNDLETVFCFRIDSDYGSPGQVNELYRMAREYAVPMTWFLHVEAHEGWLETFRKFEGQEMALHGYRHKTFRSYEENHANIAEARSVLATAGINCTGFAAPNGIWNKPLAQAMEDLALSYSSEFTLDYDTLPFYPVVDHQETTVLQVPLHPISIGNFLRVKANENVMREYFRWWIARKSALNDPVIFYHHPTHEHWNILEDIFREATERGMAKLSFGEYAAWWKKREQVVYECRYEDGVVATRFERNDPDVLLRVHVPEGVGLISDTGRCAIHQIPIAKRNGQLPAIDNDRLKALRKPNPHLLRYTFEDFMVRSGR